jgi:hypothetical protein
MRWSLLLTDLRQSQCHIAAHGKCRSCSQAVSIPVYRVISQTRRGLPNLSPLLALLDGSQSLGKCAQRRQQAKKKKKTFPNKAMNEWKKFSTEIPQSSTGKLCGKVPACLTDRLNQMPTKCTRQVCTGGTVQTVQGRRLAVATILRPSERQMSRERRTRHLDSKGCEMFDTVEAA